MIRRTVAVAGLAFLLVAPVYQSAGQDTPKATPSRQVLQAPSENQLKSGKEFGRPALHKRDVRYRLRPGDVLELAFSFTPEFNQTLTVQPDGYVTLRGLGDLPVAGQTVPELTQALRNAYGKILHEPVITVDLKDFEKPYFIAGGEVGHPGKFELRGDTTVTQAVALAGGFRETAKHSQVLLFRRVSDDWAEVKMLNVKQMLQAGNLREDLHLQPGDMLFVPKNALSKIKPFIPIPGIGVYYNPSQF
ncbi:MAG: polysaccharide export protein [Acidobacteria bacterium]|nr:polysaccharide export protein [Acidobacteriota bacterium]